MSARKTKPARQRRVFGGNYNPYTGTYRAVSCLVATALATPAGLLACRHLFSSILDVDALGRFDLEAVAIRRARHYVELSY